MDKVNEIFLEELHWTMAEFVITKVIPNITVNASMWTLYTNK